MTRNHQRASIKARTLRIENLEERRLLSATTFEDVATLDALTAFEGSLMQTRASLDRSAVVSVNATNVVTITTLADVVDETDDVVSLREAVEVLARGAGGTTIAFEESLSGGTITLGATAIKVYDSLTIDALGRSRAFRIVGADETIEATLDGLTIKGGSTSLNGGGVYASNAYLTINAARCESRCRSGRVRIADELFRGSRRGVRRVF